MLTGTTVNGFNGQESNNWVEKYSERHRFQRVTELPSGISLPKKVRIYQRFDHFVLQWWDRQVKKTLSTRVDGDLIEAITKAREIDEKLLNFRRTSSGNPKLNHNQLIDLYKTYLEKRADMGEIAPATVMRYKNAIVHFEHFVKQPHILSRYDRVCKVDSNFAMDFRAYLKNLWITPNGHSKGMKKRLTSAPYVINVVRGLFVWAMNDRSGHLLPEGFINPFAGKYRDTEVVSEDLLGDPDITLNMAVDFLRECDVWQLPLFCMYIFYGLRVSEPCWLFTDSISDDWIKIECDKSIGYVTKGRRGKRLPLVAPVKRALELAACLSNNGLLFQRRQNVKLKQVRGLTRSREEFRETFSKKVMELKVSSASRSIEIRNEIHHQSGGLTYGLIEKEFLMIRDRLRWPKNATLKDFRHLFSTCIGNSGIPEHYRKYLMGQSQGKAAIVRYTHLNQLQEQFHSGLQRQMGPALDALRDRLDELERNDLMPEPDSSEPVQAGLNLPASVLHAGMTFNPIFFESVNT
jgi:hypothetical protein